MNFRTYEDLSRIISNNLYKIPNDVDLIVGVPKSGLMAASIIALYLNLPLTDIDSLLEGKIYNSGTCKIRKNWIKRPDEARKILVVDDSINSGQSFKKVRMQISNSKYVDKALYLAIYVNEKSIDLPDIYFDLCPMPRMFEWNYMYHGLLEKACVDIDGVLCQDPTPEENDDGEKYINFISNVKPRIIPTVKIGYLVTTRLEKYRKYTEEWLKTNNIQYEHLIMLNLPSKEERIRLGVHAKFKAEQYNKIDDAVIFIESNNEQAKEIAQLTNKPVFCVDSCKFFYIQEKNDVSKTEFASNNSAGNERIIRKYFRKIVPLKIRKILKKAFNINSDRNIRNIFRKIVPFKVRKLLKKVFVKHHLKGNSDYIPSTLITNSDKLLKKCIICGNEFDYFIAGGSTEELFSKHHIIGGGYRKNCACPKCGIIDRERWLYYVIKNKTDIEKLNGKILHFAPEKSIIDYISSNKNIDYYTCDIQIGRAMHIVDITNIQFKDETFDYVICNHVMEHIPDEKKAISEIKRVLKKDGKWIFSFPICTDMVTQEDKNVVSVEDRLRLYGQEDHVRLYGKDFVKRFEKYGLNIEIYSPKKELKKNEIEQYGLISDDIIMIATKKINGGVK